MARPEKTQAVQEISERFQGSTAALLTEYRGLSVAAIGELRRALREVDADYKVLKNTLARIAAREVGMEDLVGMLEGPTAIAFCKGDAVAAAKALDDAAKKYPVLVIKGGILRGKTIDAAQAQALASLEPREVQLAKIAMLLNAPLQRTVNVFAAPLRDLASMLGQVLAKKETGELPSGAGAAAGAPETAPPTPGTASPTDAPASGTALAAPGGDTPTDQTGDAPENSTTEAGDRGSAEVADAVAEAESDTSEGAAEAAEASSDTEEKDQTTDEAAAGGNEKEE